MTRRKEGYVPISKRPYMEERPIVSKWPVGDGIEEEFREAQRRRHLIKTLSNLSEFARSEGYPLAYMLLKNAEEEISLLLFREEERLSRQRRKNENT